MIKNYFKIALRNLSRNKSFTFLNITGLVVGMAGAMLISLWIMREVSVDRFHEKGEQIYQAWNRNTFEGEIWCWNQTPKPLAPVLYSDYPEVINYTRHYYLGKFLFSVEEKNLKQEAAFVDSTFFQMFSFPLIEGNPNQVFANPHSVVISESMATRLFGNQDAVGKVITTDGHLPLTITGIMQDIPGNTIFEFDALLPWSLMVQMDYSDDYWGNNSIQTYVELEENVNIASLNDKVKTVTQEHSIEDTEVFLYPLEDLHLYSEFENGIPVGGKIDNVKMFGLIAIFILLIACINFMNLSTSRSEKRAKEVGIRKISGARREMLIAQFMMESIILTMISGLLAILLAQLLLPIFNNIIGLELAVPFENIWFWLSFGGFILLTGLLAGSYPALFLSSFKPIKVLKGTFKNSKSLLAPRKILVIVQFTFAIILIASTIIVRQQIEHAQKREKGYDDSQLIYLSYGEQMAKAFPAFRAELTQNDAVHSITRTMSPVTEGWSNSWGITWDGKDPESKITIHRFGVDQDAVSTLGLELVQGREIDISKYATDSLAVVLSEEAVKVMGFDEPIGQTIYDNNKAWQVVGVVKNFINGSPFSKDRPMVIEGPESWLGIIHIKLKKGVPVKESLAKVGEAFTLHYPNIPFEYEFIDESFAMNFANQKRIANLTSIFSTLAIIISCLGLFGLSAYAAEQRSKEIGIRKVLGASVARILVLLSSDFVKLVFIAIILAIPISWWLMSEWLLNFSYRISISVYVFIVTAILALSIAVLTIISQAYRTANINPVNSLKDE
ncbi:ABC transporter permease [Marivirga sp. S37H4]|uniref:ABC transporter permease n=1 Tax=Marivirga aurantiaca TaxID=2802615 RepID=A0A934X0E3_9BACT|nr:ABC transporter permease [Marivirga aurantiaca]MBK6266359.1 ABC transporter permease [Marivirga aurantiaca]